MPDAPASRILRAGWTPAAVLLALVTALLLGTGTALGDVVRFAAYAVLALVLPGTLLWRLLRPRTPRPWLEDVVLGTVLGYAVELVAYLPARAAGVPLLVLAWPAAVYAGCVLTARGRAAWRPPEAERLPAVWSWSVAAVVAYLVAFVARASWWRAGLEPERLRVIGPDATFQLALTGELRHHVLPVIPWVSGEPLHYHWLTYVHLASASWVSGVEPVVLLRRLAPLLMAVLVVAAVALIAVRVARRTSVGPWAAGLLVVVHSPAFAATEADHFQRQEFTSAAIFGSPTMTFGSVLFCGVLFCVVELLRDRPARSTWPLLVLFLAATSGAKATFAPMVVAGALTVVAVGLLRGRPPARHVGLLAVVTVSWLTFQLGFYGGESTGLRITAAGTLDFAAASYGAVAPDPLSAAGLLTSAVVVLLWLVHLAGMAGLLPRGGWREPLTAFLFGLVASGVGAALLLDLGLFSQQWFVSSTQVAAAVGAAAGFSRLLPPGSPRELRSLIAVAALTATAGMAVVWSLGDTEVPDPGPALTRLWQYAGGFLVVVALLLLLAGLSALLVARGLRTRTVLLVACAGLTGLGLFRFVQLGTELVRVPWPEEPVPAAQDTTVGDDGVEAARWLRARSSPEDLLAINAHTLTPASDLLAVFWLAGYAERRVLVEGWGYTPRHARAMSATGVEFDEVPFWDPDLLAANDGVFTDPSPAAVDAVAAYGVDWLVLDRRFPADPEALSAVLEPALEVGDYVVYRVPRG